MADDPKTPTAPALSILERNSKPRVKPESAEKPEPAPKKSTKAAEAAQP